MKDCFPKTAFLPSFSPHSHSVSHLLLSIFTSLLSPPLPPPLLSLYLSLLHSPSRPLQRHHPPFVCSEALPAPQRSEVARLTVTNKLRPHRESLNLLSPTASLLVCVCICSFGNNPKVIASVSELQQLFTETAAFHVTLYFFCLYICALLKG